MNTDILYIASPIVIGFIVSMICSPDSRSGSTVKFRPPPWVFSVVWSYTILNDWICVGKFKKYKYIFYNIINTT